MLDPWGAASPALSFLAVGTGAGFPPCFPALLGLGVRAGLPLLHGRALVPQPIPAAAVQPQLGPMVTWNRTRRLWKVPHLEGRVSAGWSCESHPAPLGFLTFPTLGLSLPSQQWEGQRGCPGGAGHSLHPLCPVLWKLHFPKLAFPNPSPRSFWEALLGPAPRPSREISFAIPVFCRSSEAGARGGWRRRRNFKSPVRCRPGSPGGARRDFTTRGQRWECGRIPGRNNFPGPWQCQCQQASVVPGQSSTEEPGPRSGGTGATRNGSLSLRKGQKPPGK